MPAKLERCVEEVERRGGVENAYAICQASVMRKRKHNPEAESQAMYESFHGRASGEVVEFEEEEHFHENLAALGVLVELRVETVTGLKRSLGFETGDGADKEGNPVWPFGPGQPLGSRTTVYKMGKRGRRGTTSVTASVHKGYTVYKTGDAFLVPELDRESWFDTKRDAQRFIDDEVKLRKANPEPGEKWEYGYRVRQGGKWKTLHAVGQIKSTDATSITFTDGTKIRQGMVEQTGEGLIRRKQNSGPVSSAMRYGGKVLGDVDRRLGKVIGFKGNPAGGGGEFYKPGSKLTFKGSTYTVKRQVTTPESANYAFLVTKGGENYIAWVYAWGDAYRGKVFDVELEKRSSIRDYTGRKSNPDAISTTTTLLTSNEDGTQLFLIGGDQSVDLDALQFSKAEQEKELITIGECFFVSYLTQKDFDKFETIVYEHPLGEETGVCPTLIYDRMNKRLMLSGGEYYIPRPMFETSGGIHN